VILATAMAARSSDRDVFDLSAQRVPATILRCEGMPEEVRLISHETAIRLSLISGTLLDGPVRLSFHLNGDRHLPIRLRALRAFDSLATQRHISPLPSPSKLTSRKMAMLLATLDGLARGWSQKQIAIALFGETAVAADWGGRSDFLKSRVRRLIAWAETLSGDAYLSLLQR
jgi:hypothetical protein